LPSQSPRDAQAQKSNGGASPVQDLQSLPPQDAAFVSLEMQRQRYQALMNDLQRLSRQARAGTRDAPRTYGAAAGAQAPDRENGAKGLDRSVQQDRQALYEDLLRKAKGAEAEREKQREELEKLRQRQAERREAESSTAAGGSEPSEATEDSSPRRFRFVRSPDDLTGRLARKDAQEGEGREEETSDAPRADGSTGETSSDDQSADATESATEPKAGSNSARGHRKKGSTVDIASTPGLPEQLGEIVAIDLSPEEAQRLSARFGITRTSKTELAGSGVTLSRLKLPKGMSAVEAEGLLSAQMPLGRFARNRAYHIFASMAGAEDMRWRRGPRHGSLSKRSATEEGAAVMEESGVIDSAARSDPTTEPPAEDVPAGAPAGPAVPGQDCKGEACFPRKLIRWTQNLTSCAKDARIGVIDTSFDISHPTFSEIKSRSGQFLDNESPSPYDWHGTAVLSLLAGDSRSATPGLVPDASFYLATAFKTDEHGNASTDTVRLLKALDWLDQWNVEYVNMSFSGPRDPLFERAIERMQAKGVVFVAAAGNQGPTAPPSYPAAYPQVIAVTAVNRNMESYRYANRGDYVDIAAPGVEIWTALPDAKQGFRTGTSFAAPFVTAVLAARNDRAASKSELVHRLALQDLGPPGPDPIYGRGLVLAPKTCTAPPSGIAQRKVPGLPPQMSVGAVNHLSD
jgi:hypothetical protein